MHLPQLNLGHDSWRAQLSAHVDGRLDAREQASLDRHLDGCAACRLELEQLRETVALIRTMPEVVAPRSFVVRAADVARVQPTEVNSGWSWGGWLGGSALQGGLRLGTMAAGFLLVGVVTYDVGFGTSMRSDSDVGRATSLAAPAAASVPPQDAQQKAAGAQELAVPYAATAEQPVAPKPLLGAPQTRNSAEPAPQSQPQPSAGAQSPPAVGAQSSAGGSGQPTADVHDSFGAVIPAAPASGNIVPASGAPQSSTITSLRLAEAVLTGLVIVGGAAAFITRRRDVE